MDLFGFILIYSSCYIHSKQNIVRNNWKTWATKDTLRICMSIRSFVDAVAVFLPASTGQIISSIRDYIMSAWKTSTMWVYHFFFFIVSLDSDLDFFVAFSCSISACSLFVPIWSMFSRSEDLWAPRSVLHCVMHNNIYVLYFFKTAWTYFRSIRPQSLLCQMPHAFGINGGPYVQIVLEPCNASS